MNKNKALLAGAAMVALSMPLAQKEAKAANATIDASAVVVDAIQLAPGDALHFGSMSIASAGAVTVDTAGVRSGGSGGVNPITGSSLEQNGTFTLTMPDANADFDVAFPIDLGGAPNNLVVNQIYLAFPGGGTATLQTGTETVTNVAISGASGGGTINVGGRLDADGAIDGGTYTGSVVLTANYN